LNEPLTIPVTAPVTAPVTTHAAAAHAIFAIVPAGGTGSRLGSVVPKQYVELRRDAGTSITVIEETVGVLLQCQSIAAVVVVVARDDKYADHVFAPLIKAVGNRLIVLFEGGATRRDSVLAGCRYVQTHYASQDLNPWCLVHDAARPGITSREVEAMIHTLVSHPVGGLLALPLADTVKQSTARGSGLVGTTLDRSTLWAAQTPQMFRVALLVKAIEKALENNADVTDESSAVEALGLSPVLINGSRQNFKITTNEDLVMMRNFKNTSIAYTAPQIRIGQGFDSHALVPGRPLILGGVRIASDKGLLGHSDADALLHAITDAILGATGKGDIGCWFPDTSAEFEAADSAVLLAKVMTHIYADGWHVGNVDATVIAQAPKLEPYMTAMVERIAAILQIDAAQVNIKAKTNEKLGHLGRGEAIAVHANALLFKELQ
jgi:2-C-methyl-D-erythritol 4-phosphate cytidylyltransferase / 2-C-methyl-D-erythritol 2,4-cyclodiphosphate synthase